MEKALQYEYEDIFKSKMRKISSFKSWIVLYGVHSSSECLDAGLQSFVRLSL